MEKIKNILSGNTHNETPTHESGQTTGTTGHTGLTGEGSHLSKTHDTTGTGNTSGLTGQHTTGTGVGNTQHSGIESGNTTAGPHDSNLANKADPFVDSDRSKAPGHSGLTGNTGVENTQHSGIGSGNNQTSDDVPRGPGGGILNTSGHNATGQHGTTGQDAGLAGQGSHFGSTRDTTAGPHDSNIANKADPFVDSDRSKATGHSGQATSTNPSDFTSHHTGNTGHSGPHQTEAANRLDPSVNNDRSQLEDASHHSAKHGGGSEAADKHHLGRDAAVGAGGVGLAEHEHNKHQNQGTTEVGSTGISHSEHQPGAAAGLDGPAPNTAGPHKQDWLNKLDPRVNANPETSTTGSGPFKASAADYPPGTSKPYDPTTGHIANPAHHGVKSVNPDGSTAKTANPAHHGGSVADTLPGRNVETRHSKTDSGVAGVSTDSTTSGPHSSNLANKADPSVDSDRSKEQHHYGRDAAVAGGVGGAAYEADKHHDNKHHDNKHDKDHTTSTTDKHEHKEHKGGLLSFLHRDKNKKYSKEEEAEFDRQEREHNSSHKDRDAALGGAAAGGATHSAYRSDQHQHATAHDNNKPLPTAPGNHGIGTGAGTQNALASDHNDSHLGRDAAAIGGAGAIGQHEHNKHAGAVPLAEKPVGQDLGDKLHGVERNRGVTGASGFPGTEGFGSSTTHSGSGVGSHTSTDNQHHLGRDAAVGAGGIGAVEHEHRQHEDVTGNQGGLTGSGSQYDNNSGLTGSTHGQHTTGLGSSALGGDHEYRKHDITTGQQSGLTGNHGLTGHDQQQSDITGNHGSSGLTGSDDRNRLHKDPPSSHVPGSGSERERLVGEGERNIGGDTGVANSHSNAPNASTNY